MKSLILLFALIGLLSSPVKIVKIEIKQVDFDLNTIKGITCDDLEKGPKEIIKTSSITDKKEIKKFASYMKEIKYDNKAKYIDVRAKVWIHYSDQHIDTLCISNGKMLYNGKMCYLNPEIKDFVRNH